MHISSTRITLGTVQLGMDYGISNSEGKPSVEKAYKILDAAIEGGINTFDTAAGYGESEVILGNYFNTNKSVIKNPKIVTKISIPNQMNHWTFKKIKNTILRLTERSLQRLKLERINCIMLHNASNLYEYKEKIVEALIEVKSKRYVENIGVSVYEKADINEFLKYDYFNSIQIPINLMDSRLVKDKKIEQLKDKSIEIYARSLYLQGLFFMNPDKLPTKLVDARKYLIKLNEISHESGLTVAEIAFGYIRDIKQIDNLIIGADNPKQVKENLGILSSPSLEPKYVLEIQEFFADVPEMILNPLLWK